MRSGFTLIEVVVVMVLLGLTAAISAPSLIGLARPDVLDPASGLVSALTYARKLALESGDITVLRLTVPDTRYWVLQRTDTAVLVVHMGVLDNTTIVSSRPVHVVLFHPSGVGSGDTIEVSAGTSSVRVLVDPRTGEVMSAR